MLRLALGVLLFGLVHLFPALSPTLRSRAVRRLGEKPYKALFAFALVAALVLIVGGWKQASPAPLYVPPAWGAIAALLVMLPAAVLFPSPYLPNNLRRTLRHPQLTAVTLWGIGHLLANGEARAVLLFGGLAAWSVAQMLLINRREGPRALPEPAPWSRDLALTALGGALFVALLYVHGAWFGVAPLDRLP